MSEQGRGVVNKMTRSMSPRELKVFRAWMGWTQEDLARVLGVHPQTVTKWETRPGEHGREPQPYLALALKGYELAQAVLEAEQDEGRVEELAREFFELVQEGEAG